MFTRLDVTFVVSQSTTDSGPKTEPQQTVLLKAAVAVSLAGGARTPAEVPLSKVPKPRVELEEGRDLCQRDRWVSHGNTPNQSAFREGGDGPIGARLESGAGAGVRADS